MSNVAFACASLRWGGAMQLSPEGTRARCSGLKPCSEILLGFSGAHKQSLEHQGCAACYSACCRACSQMQSTSLWAWLPWSMQRVPSDEQKPPQSSSAGVCLLLLIKSAELQQRVWKEGLLCCCFFFIICTAALPRRAAQGAPCCAARGASWFKAKPWSLPCRARRKCACWLCLQGCERCASTRGTAGCQLALPSGLWEAGWSSVTRIRVSQMNTG